MLPSRIDVGVQHEEFHGSPPQVVPAPPHTKSRIGHLALAIAGADVVIAEHRKERHLVGQQLLIRLDKEPIQLGRIAVRINVVTRQQHQVHRLAPVHHCHLLGHRDLVTVATARIGHRQHMQAGPTRGRSGKDRG